jgi:starch-binding outer membrane protein, SusD/RagB family
MKNRKIMIRLIYFVGVVLLLTGSSCKKYLSLDPPNDLSGNNFWQTKGDIEAFTNGTYELLRKAVTRGDLTQPAGNDEFPFFIFSGDFRGAPVQYGAAGWGRTYILDLANNNLRNILPGTYWGNIWNMQRFQQWDRFYKVIAAANIAYVKIDDVKDASLSDAQRRAYKAEAVFLRNFCYFLMVRNWGDVPYYTDAYHSAPLKRMPMAQVLKACVADMMAVKDDLPWTYSDPVFVAVRAMRGSALALLMHMNMWLASFDEGSKTAYYEAVDRLGDQLRNENGGAYTLLPLERTGEIFKGRSKEGLFEIPQNKNYNESFGWSTYYDHVKYDDRQPTSYPYISYDSKFMQTIYPEGQPDKRTQIWYRPGTLYSGDVRFRMSKFLISTDPNALDGFGFDASQTVFRYPDAILLQAEALAELGQDGKARQVTNIVRARAEAPDLTVSGEALRTEIFYERCRELMGEGHYWYDVVRTRRIIDNEYKFGYHCTVDQYKMGCWTWPIDKSALVNNPGMTLNTYWQ